MEMSVDQARARDRDEPVRLAGWKPAGATLIALGVALLADVAVFAAYVAATGVTVKADNPAADPIGFASQLVSGSRTGFWLWYVALAVLAALAFMGVQALDDRLRTAGSRLPIRQLGTSALALYIVIALVSATVDRAAGSAALTGRELAAAIPLLFAVLVPALLGSFNLVAAVWIGATSLAGWRTGVLPRWLVALGAVTSLLLLGGVTGQAGFEILSAPWLVAAGAWMATR
jgi:hypothetical protein